MSVRLRCSVLCLATIACSGNSSSEQNADASKSDASTSDDASSVLCAGMCDAPLENADQLVQCLQACVAEAGWLDQLAPNSLKPTTPNLKAVNALILDGDVMPKPVPCSDCVATRFNGNVTGITLDNAASDKLTIRFQRATIAAGASFRIRVSLFSEYPFFPSVIPVVAFVEPTTTDCSGDSYRCELDQVCYAAERQCIDCDQSTWAECACRVAAGAQPNGAPCQYPISFDQIADGTCQEGVCQAL